MSVKTIETHRQRIKQKLCLTNGTELTRLAAEWLMRAARKRNGADASNEDGSTNSKSTGERCVSRIAPQSGTCILLTDDVSISHHSRGLCGTSAFARATLPAAERPVDALIPWLLREDAQLRGVPFAKVIQDATGKK